MNRVTHLNTRCLTSVQRLSLIYLVKEHSGCQNQKETRAAAGFLLTLVTRPLNSIGQVGKKDGGAKRDRTADLLNANQALSQLS